MLEEGVKILYVYGHLYFFIKDVNIYSVNSLGSESLGLKSNSRVGVNSLGLDKVPRFGVNSFGLE